METERYKLILDVATEGFWDWDLKTGLAYLSPRFCELIGYSPDDTIFDSTFIKQIVHPDDHQQVFGVFIDQIREKRNASVVEHRIIAREGTVLWVESRAKIVEYDEQGGPSRLVGTIVDITDRKQAELRLQKSEESFRLTFEGASDAIFWADAATGMIINCNRAAEEMLETPREEIIGKHQTCLHPPDLAEHFANQFKTTVALHDQVDNAEAIVLSKSGRRIPVHIKHSLTSVGGRDIMLGVFRDVSVQKQTEEELRQSHTMLNNLSLQVPGVLFQALIYQDGHISIPYSSEKLNEIYELSQDCVRKNATAVFERFHPDDRDRIFAGIFEATKNLTRWECEYRVLLPRQGMKWLYGAALPQKLDDGTVVFYGIVMDISERKQTEETLSHSQKLLSSILENAPLAFFVKDVIDQFRVILWNRSAEKIFGIPASEMLGKNAHDLWPKEQADSFLADDLATVASRVLSDIPEEVSRHPEKGTIYLHTRKIPLIDSRGDVSHIVVISEDITERRMMQAELVKSHKLESLGVLAGGIAHDFNNILTGIIGYISFAQKFLDASHRSAAILLEAKNAAYRAAELARQLLTFAKGGAPIKTAVSVQHIMKESASFVLRGSNVLSVIELPDDLPALDVDEGQIIQVLHNIIINASQAMPGGGTINITGEMVTVDAGNIMSLSAGRYVRLTISDTGCGISEENQKRIFDPYFTTKTGGSGLGLATAHSIVSKHGGYIGVHSVVGTGTSFELLLPVSENKVVREDAGMSSEAVGGQSGFSVLVMDDEQLIRDMSCHMMNEMGYNVQMCANGEEAIALYKTAMDIGSPYSAVIMDLTIPGGMGGREAAKHILAIDPNARLIVSSGYSTDPVLAEFATFGFCASLPKPYTLDGITKALGAALPATQQR
ncbi:MAG: PAS domain S-box protein [Desulfuromonadales bacterium]|nr:PAS domain S-box protein [Desulfuromonadales bacterium]